MCSRNQVVRPLSAIGILAGSQKIHMFFLSWPFWDYSLSAALFDDTNKILLKPWSGERTQQSTQIAECSFITSVARKENYQVQRLSQADGTLLHNYRSMQISPCPEFWLALPSHQCPASVWCMSFLRYREVFIFWGPYLLLLHLSTKH